VFSISVVRKGENRAAFENLGEVDGPGGRKPGTGVRPLEAFSHDTGAANILR
jgi:hypothetical protein